jgi:acetylornithine deacetylase
MNSSRDLLKTLVAFDTTSRESNLQLIEFVAITSRASMCLAN